MHPTLEKAQKLMDAKSKDYGQPDDARSIYFPFDDASYLTMINTKMQRLMSLRGREAMHENQLDTVLDMINYLAFYGAYLEGKHGGD